MQLHVIVVATEKTALPDQRYRGTPRQLKSDAVNAAKTKLRSSNCPILIVDSGAEPLRNFMPNWTKPDQTYCTVQRARRHPSFNWDFVTQDWLY